MPPFNSNSPATELLHAETSPRSSVTRRGSLMNLDEVIPSRNTWIVHVLAPWAFASHVDPDTLSTLFHSTRPDDDSLIVSEWGPEFEESTTEYLTKLGVREVIWHKIHFKNYKEVIDSIPNSYNVVVLDLMDGQESDGWPGVTVISYLEESGLAFTGARSKFFSLDTIKANMKECLVRSGASTPGYVDLSSDQLERRMAIEKISQLKMPIIVKPSPSSGSRGITERSVCYEPEKAYTYAMEVKEEFGGVYVEEFITGREFTALVAGDTITGVRSYPVVERVFSKSLPGDHQFLSYGMKWKNWLTGWWYALAPDEEQDLIQSLAVKIYETVGGNGYARLDLRMDTEGQLYCLDVNANCSMDSGDDTAMGLILRSATLTLSDFLEVLIRYGFKKRNENIQLKRRPSLADVKQFMLSVSGDHIETSMKDRSSASPSSSNDKEASDAQSNGTSKCLVVAA